MGPSDAKVYVQLYRVVPVVLAKSKAAGPGPILESEVYMGPLIRLYHQGIEDCPCLLITA